jgi:6-phosphogluconate dehydrogenase
MVLKKHGNIVAFNCAVLKVDDFMNGHAKRKKTLGVYSLPEFVGSLKCPRKTIMQVKAGKAADEMIE